MQYVDVNVLSKVDFSEKKDIMVKLLRGEIGLTYKSKADSLTFYSHIP